VFVVTPVPLRGSKTKCFRQSKRYSSARHYLKYKNNSWNFSLPISLLKRKKVLFLHDLPVCVCVHFHLNFGNSWLIFTKLCMNIMPLEDTPLLYFIFPTMCKRYVEDAQTCEVVVLQLPFTSRSWNYIWKGMLTVVFL